jgi:hypothetical protein
MKLRSIAFDKPKPDRLNSTCNRQVGKESVIWTIVKIFNAQSDKTGGMY